MTAGSSLAIHDRPPRTTVAGEASPPRRPPGRPVGGILNAPKITAAAFTLINDSGYQGLTMAALARSLNVSKSALYNHVTCKQDVLRLLEEHLIAQVNVSCFRNFPWEEAIKSWALSYRDVFARHTPLVPLIAILPVADAPKTLAMYEEVTIGLLTAGFPEDRIIPIIAALEAFIFGAALDVNAPQGIFNPGRLAHHAPIFTAAQAHHASDGSTEQPSDAAFRLGLAAFTKGLSDLRSNSDKRRHDSNRDMDTITFRSCS